VTARHGSGSSKQDGDERLAKGLGWFSIALGVAEVAAPGSVAQLIGLDDEGGRRAVLRAYGLREIAAGIGILSQPRAAGWMWGRVAGDAVDLASLGWALTAKDADRTKVAAAIGAVVGVTALDVVCAQRLCESCGTEEKANDHAPRNTKTVIINRSREEVYGFWRDFSKMPTYVRHLESVEMTGERRSRWAAKGPAGKTVEWEAEIVEDVPNERIRWQSLPGADIENSGSVHFERAAGGRGTLVRVELNYNPPGGVVGSAIAKLFRAEPGDQIEDALRALKQVIETGEVTKSDASIHTGAHPGQPPAEIPGWAARA
jgi:uncharacterized membrane protein